ncbi:phosphate ABC transporter permease subunit PstC [Methanoregula sp.]|uniref:phosphate ABC transporter permease subunit PstC n=1 Tax=Methanoregula sp. TaxID=2052170 RepID=UPI003C3E7E48
MNGKSDHHRFIFLFCSIVTALSIIAIVGDILFTAAPAVQHQGLGIIFGTVWDYTSHQYGAWSFIMATLMVTVATIVLAVPVGLATALFLSEWAPGWLDQILMTLIELLVGVPSVVYGILGFFVLRSYFSDFINPFIGKSLGFIPLLTEGHNYGGLGIPLAATVLAIMILPTIVALSREAMRGVPAELREGSAALGATQWETIRHLVLPMSMSGIITGVIMGIMRAMGETMAIVMLIGNVSNTPISFLSPGEPLTAKILLDIDNFIIDPDARSALFALGAILLVMEIGFIVAIHIISNQMKKQMEGAT